MNKKILTKAFSKQAKRAFVAKGLIRELFALLKGLKRIQFDHYFRNVFERKEYKDKEHFDFRCSCRRVAKEFLMRHPLLGLFWNFPIVICLLFECSVVIFHLDCSSIIFWLSLFYIPRRTRMNVNEVKATRQKYFSFLLASLAVMKYFIECTPYLLSFGYFLSNSPPSLPWIVFKLLRS